MEGLIGFFEHYFDQHGGWYTVNVHEDGKKSLTVYKTSPFSGSKKEIFSLHQDDESTCFFGDE